MKKNSNSNLFQQKGEDSFDLSYSNEENLESHKKFKASENSLDSSKYKSNQY